jgi:hypothetical protein
MALIKVLAGLFLFLLQVFSSFEVCPYYLNRISHFFFLFVQFYQEQRPSFLELRGFTSVLRARTILSWHLSYVKEF